MTILTILVLSSIATQNGWLVHAIDPLNLNAHPDASSLPSSSRRDFEFDYGDPSPPPPPIGEVGMPDITTDPPTQSSTISSTLAAGGNDDITPSPMVAASDTVNTTLSPSSLGANEEKTAISSSIGEGINPASTTNPSSLAGTTVFTMATGGNENVTSSQTLVDSNNISGTLSPTSSVGNGDETMVSSSTDAEKKSDVVISSPKPSLGDAGVPSSRPTVARAPNFDVKTQAPTPVPSNDDDEFSDKARGDENNDDGESPAPDLSYPSGYDYWSKRFPTSDPTHRPTHEYISKSGDPFSDEDVDVGDFDDDKNRGSGVGGVISNYLDGVESPEDMEKDKNVQVVAGSLVAVFVVLWLATAHQVMENPDGLCAG